MKNDICMQDRSRSLATVYCGLYWDPKKVSRRILTELKLVQSVPVNNGCAECSTLFTGWRPVPASAHVRYLLWCRLAFIGVRSC